MNVYADATKNTICFNSIRKLSLLGQLIYSWNQQVHTCWWPQKLYNLLWIEHNNVAGIPPNNPFIPF